MGSPLRRVGIGTSGKIASDCRRGYGGLPVVAGQWHTRLAAVAVRRAVEAYRHLVLGTGEPSLAAIRQVCDEMCVKRPTTVADVREHRRLGKTPLAAHREEQPHLLPLPGPSL